MRSRLSRRKKRKAKKVGARCSLEFFVGVLTAILLFGVIGSLASPSIWLGASLGSVVGLLLGVAMPKVFFAIGDAILTGLI